jgi:hypothetical protein
MNEPAYRRLVEALDHGDPSALGAELARPHPHGRRADGLVRPSPYLAFYARVVEAARAVPLAASA